MPSAVKHAFVSGKGAASDATLVDGDNWDAAHVSPPFSYPLVGQSQTLTNLASAEGDYTNSARYWFRFDLSDMTDIRFSCRVRLAGASGSYLAFRYTTDLTGATGWTYLDGSTGPRIAIDATGMPTGPASDAWLALPAGAKARVLIGIRQGGGDGTADPECSAILMEVR